MDAFVFWHVDAFAEQPFKGNPCAVVFDAERLTPQRMQAIAAEFNLSETVFLSTPTVVEADYRARIFTPRTELPFAGHPTLSAAFAVCERGIYGADASTTLLRQECGIGIVPIEIARTAEATNFVMTQGAPAERDIDLDPAEVAASLGCAPERLAELPIQAVSTGVFWLLVPLRSARDVAALAPDMAAVERLSRRYEVVGIAAFALEAETPGCSVKIRAFGPAEGIPEDPATGSAHGCIGAYIAHNKLMGGESFAYLAEQGAETGRGAVASVRVSRTADDTLSIEVGGRVVKVMEGTIFLD